MCAYEQLGTIVVRPQVFTLWAIVLYDRLMHSMCFCLKMHQFLRKQTQPGWQQHSDQLIGLCASFSKSCRVGGTRQEEVVSFSWRATPATTAPPTDLFYNECKAGLPVHAENSKQLGSTVILDYTRTSKQTPLVSNEWHMEQESDRFQAGEQWESGIRYKSETKRKRHSFRDTFREERGRSSKTGIKKRK